MIWKFFSLILLLHYAKTEYFVGIGINDITGPPVEANFMGYANPAQTGRGIHMRLYSRTFIFASPNNDTRFVFTSVDCGMISQIVKTEVARMLKEKYGNLYTEQNVALSSTHSHSGPAGFHQYILFDVTSLGFVKETFKAMTEGIFASIVKAHNNIRRARVFINQGELLNANINRSPTSYLANPPEERSKYRYDVDKEMTVLKIVAADKSGAELGMINWFAVHGTSMNNTNRLVSGDNKGYAAQLVESAKGSRPGEGKFVAAFAQSNLGDVSPNIMGAKCIDTGLPCDNYSSTCGGRNEKCIAFGPGRDMYESTKIIGKRQAKAALDLYSTANQEIVGPLSFKHQFKNMTHVPLRLQNGSIVHTCLPAMGYSFAAGTTDGPGAFDFTQGSVKSNPFWNIIRDLLKSPSKELQACQSPKPILLATGEISFPNEWQPHIVETQVLRLGQLIIAAVPGEFTTMSGRRIRRAIHQTLSQEKTKGNFTVVVAGLSNTYADYIATFEEYQKQRYEAASTIFGPHTLTAYLEQFSNLTRAMLQNKTLDAGPRPPFDDNVVGFLPPVLFDNPGIGRSFGQVLQQPPKVVKPGSVVSVKFVAANPRNSLQLGSSHLFVDRLDNTTGSWLVQHTDADWETRFSWEQKGVIAFLFRESETVIDWLSSESTPEGQYRIRYRGIAKSILSRYSGFEGVTCTFWVRA